jgi:hypothetical protein
MLGISLSIPQAAVLGAGGGSELYRIASNRFNFPTDFATFDTNYGANDGTVGHQGGNGTALARYARKDYFFTTTFAPRRGRFLFVNAVNTINGFIDGLFTVPIQRLEVYTAANVLVDIVKFDGAGAYDLGPGAKKWTDPIADLAAFSSYKLVVWWSRAAAGQSYPAMAPMYLNGEVSGAHLSNDLSLLPMNFTASTAPGLVGGDFGPAMFVAQGGAGYVGAIGFGNSIADATAISARLSTGSARGDYGFLGVGMGDANNGGPINIQQAVRYGSSFSALYQDNLNSLGGKNVIDFLKACNDLLQPQPLYNVVICEHGRNSLSENQSLDAMKGFFKGACEKMRGHYPAMPWFNTTVTPNTTVPTNGAAVPGTTQTGNGAANTAGGTIQQWNDYLLDGAGGTTTGGAPVPAITGCIDCGAVGRDPSNYTAWRTYDFSTTLLDAVTANNTNVIRVADAPDVGASLVIDAGTADIDYGSRLFTVASVVPAGGGGFTVTGCGGARNSLAEDTTAANNGRLTKAHAIGATVKEVGTTDRVHPAHRVQMGMAAAVSGAKPAITGAALAYTS